MEDGAHAVMVAAFRVASTVGAGHVGVDHLLAALTDPSEPTPAAQALADLGVTKERATAVLATGEKTEQWTVLTPAAQVVLATARGYALAKGTPTDAGHVLLALAYSTPGLVDATCQRLGTTRAAIVAALAARGVDVPRQPPPEARTGPGYSVTFPAADLDAVIKALTRAYPPGSAVRWGMNHIDDRGVIVADSSEAIDLVRATVTDPTTVEPLNP